jgi:Mn-dependent DtxR family transcriptional regulator
MFSLGNIKERIIERKIKEVEEHTNKRIRHMEESLNAIRKLVDDLRKETESLKKQGVELKAGEETITKMQDELRKSGEFIARGEEEIKKGFEELKKSEEELYEKIKGGSLLQEQPAADMRPAQTAQAGGVTGNIAETAEGAENADTEEQPEQETQEKSRGRTMRDRLLHKKSKEPVKGRAAKGASMNGGKGKAEQAAETARTSDAEIIEPAVEAGESPEKITGFSRSMETPLDKLFELVTSKGQMRVDQAAKAFKVKEKQIDEWARILEEHNLIEIHYPAMGKPVLKPKQRK